ncbi:MAG TPA: hypothetical protein VJ406_03925 [Dehalococcoidia bacterium]|nr:hypothetical protein [Dehalococcoidia bacterium]
MQSGLLLPIACGLNPQAAASESGIEMETHTMGVGVEYGDLIACKEL